MQIYHELEQNTPEWYEARCGIITASEMKAVLSNGRGNKPSKTRITYMNKLIAERLTKLPTESATSRDMERGHMLEPEVADLYDITSEYPTTKVGFIRNFDDLGGVGYSPDRLVGESGLVEIKTRNPHLQVEFLYNNAIPDESPDFHYTQCQCGLWVSEREWIDYASYSVNMGFHVIRAHRDEAFIKEMRIKVITFYAEMKERMTVIAGRL